MSPTDATGPAAPLAETLKLPTPAQSPDGLRTSTAYSAPDFSDAPTVNHPRTAVPSKTTAVSGRVAHRQAQKYAGQAAAAPTAAPVAAPAAPAADDTSAKLQELANLHAQGILSDEEFAAAKAKALGI